MLLMGPPIFYSLYKLVKPSDLMVSKDTRSHLKLYDDFEWVDKHFFELSQLSMTYYDYITWRRDDYTGETVNIVNGIRLSSNPDKINKNAPKVFFFGGSTIWGTGVNDENTIPSIYSKMTTNNVFNFGETAYLSRQSLAYLNNIIINNSLSDMSNIKIFFYDGVNDVLNKCRSENDGLGSDQEKSIQEKTKKKTQLFSFNKTFAQLQNFINKILQKFIISNTAVKVSNNLYNCSSDKKKALKVAKSLVDTWEVVSDLVENRGGKFTAILQPVAFYGNPSVNYLELTNGINKSLAEQYKAVYPLIIQLASERNFNFIDLTDAYDDCENCYIDFCHVSPQGHKILVSKLIKSINLNELQ